MTLVKIILRQFLWLLTRRRYVVQRTKIVPSSTSNLQTYLQRRDPHGNQWGSLSHLGTSWIPGYCTFWEKPRHLSLLQDVGAILFTRGAQSLSRTSFNCRIPVEDPVELWGGSSAKTVTLLGKGRPDVTLERHMVDVQKAVAEYREELYEGKNPTPPGMFLWYQRAKPLFRSKEAEHIQLESRSSTWKSVRDWKTNCTKEARYHLAGGDWLCGQWTPHKQVPSYSPRRLRGAFQQGHLLPWCQGQVHLTPRQQEWSAGQSAWSAWRRLKLGHTRRAITCLLSSTSSQRPKNVNSSVLTH